MGRFYWRLLYPRFPKFSLFLRGCHQWHHVLFLHCFPLYWGLWRASTNGESWTWFLKGPQSGLCAGTVSLSAAQLWASLEKECKLSRFYWVQLKGWTPNASLRVWAGCTHIWSALKRWARQSCGGVMDQGLKGHLLGNLGTANDTCRISA